MLKSSRFNGTLVYRFDKDLKLLLFSAVQTIEVAVRTRIIQRFSSAHGSFWFMESDKAIDKAFFYSNLDSIRREVQRSKEDFITDHFNKYSIPDLPPAWKTLEVVSLGMLSKLFRNFADKQSKDQVAADFDLPQHLILEGWLESLTTLRNHIAHHARVCNRRFPHKPELLRKPSQPWITNMDIKPYKLYLQLCCIAYWLNSIDSDNRFTIHIKELLSNYPTIDPTAMGFPHKWQQEPLWTRHI